MHVDWQAFVGPAIAALAAWVTVRLEVAKTVQRIDDKEASDKAAATQLEKALQDRHDEYCRRFDRIERKVGIANGGAAWVDRDFCREVHRAFSAEVEVLREAIEKATEAGQEAVRIGHEDRESIKNRLTKVEVVLEGVVARMT